MKTPNDGYSELNLSNRYIISVGGDDMPNTEIAQFYTQLGIAGAALFIILTFTVLLFNFVGKVNSTKKTQEGNTIDRLCDKIDLLISTIADDKKTLAEQKVSSEKDQQFLIELLGKLMLSTSEIQEKVTRIEIQTSTCLTKNTVKPDP